ncbi:SusC/RagA family TonB-linked outer membrane protein [Chitinophaga ginsengisoli]|uniref:TonB-linked SusC/RagA family outer membrane protein n=1 Tax=Chitinophaga ginsengisoli TaxID=363837 RepID=A0A2P8GMR6_9BACT|nr:SusC/RagA family TonB-linked outer membrane protein [Chitinophaga ginsengisoli]PSL35251.1 TonB-linked SusC/RagA family outer membrane protein [Chitinophaga ginsengisoli]
MRKSLIFLLSTVLVVGQVVAQNRPITGKITSADDGSPVIGATVIVKGTTTGTVTNASGEYTIQVPENATALIVKFVGMKDQEVKLGSGAKHNVVLYPDVTKLTETVVTANAIRRDKASLGYAAPTLKNDELTKGQSTSPLNALAGKVAGVNISTTANAPGSSSRIVLRGGSSIGGNNQALMVVDGVPIDNSSIIGGGDSRSTVDFGNRGNDINPDDIESITVLKGPAAAALYGSRASNGALIITTKSGKKLTNKKNEVGFNTAATFSNIVKLPDFQNEFGQGGGGVIDPRENFTWGPAFDGQVKPWGQSINGVRQMKPYSALPDNVKNFFETGKALTNNLSLSGAGEKTTYYMSINTINSDGTMPGNYDRFNKYSLRFNGTAQLNNKFYTGINLNYNKINSRMIQGGQGEGSVFDNVLQTPRDIPIDKMGDLNNPYNSYITKDANGNPTYGFYGAYTISPYYILKNYRNQNDVDRISGNFSIGYKPTAWLDVLERLGADIYSDRRQYKYPKFDFLPADDLPDDDPNKFYSVDDNRQVQRGKYGEDQYNLSEITHDLMVTAKKDFGPDFKTSLMVGNNIRQRTFNTLETQTNLANGLVIPGWYNLDNSDGPVHTFNERTTRRLVALYADLNLSYKSMLYLGATARNDWSSTLPPQNRSFFYPSVNGSFVFTELTKETGLSHILNYGKVRASWAQVGNDADPYQLRTYFNKTDISSGFGRVTFPFKSIPGYTYSNLIGNNTLKPEITTAFEVGTELNFLDNRLSLDFSYYKNKSKDQILNVPIPPSSGFSSKALNTGVVENKGIELSLRGTPIRTASGFSLELFGTYTRNKNTVVEIAKGVDQVIIGGFGGMSIVAAKGRPYGTFYSQDIQHDAQGHVIVSASTGLPLLTPTAVYFGSYNPKYQASWGANASYKGFSFSILFDTKQGNQFYSRTKDILDFTGAAAETAEGGREDVPFANSVVDDGTGKLVPNTNVVYSKYKYFTSVIPAGRHIIDASYIRLREASLSYRLPKQLLNRTPFGDLSVGIFGNNLALWTASQNKYADPEVNSGGATNEQGFDFTAQPSLRNYGFNIRVTF